ncbi:MAG TPA: hypothetical protein VHO03_03990 [Ignavibacteriales bacterium]|nr:hypothetical protein [Ignavibacteriales bacterium]
MNSRAKIYFFFIIIIASGAGCDNPAEQPGVVKNISVAGLLNADTLEQNIKVFSTSSIGDNRFHVITDASVRVSDSASWTEEFPLNASEDGIASYSSGKNTFSPGHSYFLEVKTKLGTAYGSTRLPGDFNITSHPETDTIYIPNNSFIEVELKWTRSNGAFGYIIEQDNIRKFEYSGDTLSGGSSGSSFTFSNTIKIGVSKNLIGNTIINKTVITVIAFDKNYYDHHFNYSNSAGLNGAYGYFGSGVVKRVTFFIK